MESFWHRRSVRSRVGGSLGTTALAATAIQLVFGLVVIGLGVLATATAADAADNGVSINVTVNGQDADESPGPLVAAGERLVWEYRVTVSADVGVYDLIVIDTNGATPDCDATGDGRPDGINLHPGPLSKGDSFICRATTTANSFEATHGSVALVKGTDATASSSFEGQDTTHYTTKVATTTTERSTSTSRPPSTTAGTPVPPPSSSTPLSRPVTTSASTRSSASPSDPAIGSTVNTAWPTLAIELSANGTASPSSPGPVIPPGSRISWRATVTNTGNVELGQLRVSTEPTMVLTCGSGTSTTLDRLGRGDSVDCIGTTVAELADGNVTVVSATARAAVVGSDGASLAGYDDVTASDRLHYASASMPSELAFTGTSASVETLIALALILLGCGLLTLQLRLQRSGSRDTTL